MSSLWQRFWYGALRQPYRLFTRVDMGKGQPVVLLHGIASSGATWVHVVKRLRDQPVRVVVLDLLGFGASPKPTDIRVQYDVNDHARAVIRTLRRLHGRKPVLLVGHSMGCFVAIEVATKRPDLVSGLLLYEPPFYTGLPNTNRYKLRLSAYFSLYRMVIKRQPGASRLKLAKKLLNRLYGFEINNETWIPFQRSMQNTILKQTALNDLKQLTLPVQLVYGKYDQVVINDKKKVFVGDMPNITALEISELHNISARASKFLAQLILERLQK
jgi:cis-3-alkyl-4-acyloxetan-2-one decarboxylase